MLQGGAKAKQVHLLVFGKEEKDFVFFVCLRDCFAWQTWLRSFSGSKPACRREQAKQPTYKVLHERASVAPHQDRRIEHCRITLGKLPALVHTYTITNTAVSQTEQTAETFTSVRTSMLKTCMRYQTLLYMNICK